MDNQQHQAMFGCSRETLDEMLNRPSFQLGGPAMTAMSILSDAQEMIERGDGERARQFINRAKVVLQRFLR